MCATLTKGFSAELATWAFIILCIILYLRNEQFKRDVSVVFALHRFDKPNAQSVHNILGEINQESSAFAFYVERYANVLFRKYRVTLVFGPVGYISSPGRSGNLWKRKKCVFALAGAEDSAWMQKNGDAFELALETSHYSIFWVKLSVVKAEVSSAIISNDNMGAGGLTDT
jgi:hypothetical protein